MRTRTRFQMPNMIHITIEVRGGEVIKVVANWGEIRVMVIDLDKGTGYYLEEGIDSVAHREDNGPDDLQGGRAG